MWFGDTKVSKHPVAPILRTEVSEEWTRRFSAMNMEAGCSFKRTATVHVAITKNTVLRYRTTTRRSVLYPYFPTELLSFVANIADHFGDSVYFNASGSAGSLFSGQIMKIRTISSLRSLFLGTSNSLLNKTLSASILEPQLRLLQS